MLINSMGIFGFLSKAHIDQEVVNTNQSSQTELVLSKIENEKYTITDIEKQISQIDANIDKLTSTGKAQTSITQANAQRKIRDGLVAQKQTHVASMEDLNRERLTEEAANKKLEADFGPLKYIADVFYGKPNSDQLETIVRWIITVLVTVFDPLALVLLVSSQYMLMNRKKKTVDIQKYEVLDITDNITKPKGR